MVQVIDLCDLRGTGSPSETFDALPAELRATRPDESMMLASPDGSLTVGRETTPSFP
jgi:hypothetical protein